MLLMVIEMTTTKLRSLADCRCPVCCSKVCHKTLWPQHSGNSYANLDSLTGHANTKQLPQTLLTHKQLVAKHSTAGDLPLANVGALRHGLVPEQYHFLALHKNELL